MKFSCEKALLQSAVSIASRAVSTKSSIPALEGILVEAAGSLRLTGYNLETGIRTSVEAEVREEGGIVLNARLFGEIVKKLPDETVVLSTDKDAVRIECGRSLYRIVGSSADDFPELPEVDGANGFTVEQGKLASMISGTLFAVSDNESRPIHTGSLFEADETGLTVVSVDGYRLALRREALLEKSGEAKFSFVVPGSSLSEVERIACDTDEGMRVYAGARHVLFQFGATQLISRRLEGEFLAYRNAIPKNSPVVLHGDVRALRAAIDRVALIISDRLKSPLRCLFDDGVLRVRSDTTIGSASDECALEGNGGGLEIGFNNRYLMDALKAVTDERVRLELGTAVAPCLLLPEDGSGRFLYMVLPVRLKAND